MKVVRMSSNDVVKLIMPLIDNVKNYIEDGYIDSARDCLDQIDLLQKLEGGLYFSETSPYKYNDIFCEVMIIAEGKMRIITGKNSEEWKLI